MIEKPILFSGPMVRAILAGQKTQTRRVVTRSTSDADAWQRLDLARAWVDPGLSGLDAYLKAPLLDAPGDPADERIERVRCRYVPGDRLWVRETWGLFDRESFGGARGYGVAWRATHPNPEDGVEWIDGPDDYDGRWKADERWRPSIHMPRWASRLTLAVESIRVERLNDISEEDAKAEGCQDTRVRVVSCGDVPPNAMVLINGGAVVGDESTFTIGRSARDNFRDLWQTINSKRPGCSWDANPWVWVVKFARVP